MEVSNIPEDDSPPHYALNVKTFLDENFENRFIGRVEPISWPTRSPDFSPLDVLPGDDVKDDVYKLVPGNIH